VTAPALAMNVRLAAGAFLSASLRRERNLQLRVILSTFPVPGAAKLR
jgi:hypothetical protein